MLGRSSEIEKEVEEFENDNRMFDPTVEGQWNLARCLESGTGVPRDISAAATNYRLSADQGKSDAQVRYGDCLEHGNGVPANYSESARYYRMSARQGHAEGQWRYGACLEEGIGVPKDVEEAARQYKLSADQLNSDGQWRYGYCLERGEGVERNPIEAAKCYRLSAAQFNPNGQCHYGRCFEYGIGVHPGSSSSLGWWFCRSDEGPVQSLSKAAEYYRLSADQGNSEGQWRYGDCLRNGKGVTRDPVEAMRWYKRSSDQCNVDGQRRYRFRVRVEGTGSPGVVLEVSCFTTIAHLKDAIQRESGIRPADQILTFRDRILQTGDLNDYDIHDDLTIHVSPRA
jgi:TPR repeat protein